MVIAKKLTRLLSLKRSTTGNPAGLIFITILLFRPISGPRMGSDCLRGASFCGKTPPCPLLPGLATTVCSDAARRYLRCVSKNLTAESAEGRRVERQTSVNRRRIAPGPFGCPRRGGFETRPFPQQRILVSHAGARRRRGHCGKTILVGWALAHADLVLLSPSRQGRKEKRNRNVSTLGDLCVFARDTICVNRQLVPSWGLHPQTPGILPPSANSMGSEAVHMTVPSQTRFNACVQSPLGNSPLRGFPPSFSTRNMVNVPTILRAFENHVLSTSLHGSAGYRRCRALTSSSRFLSMNSWV